jgi:hypothetical protein
MGFGHSLFRFEGVADDAGLVPASNALPARSPSPFEVVGDGHVPTTFGAVVP